MGRRAMVGRVLAISLVGALAAAGCGFHQGMPKAIALTRSRTTMPPQPSSRREWSTTTERPAGAGVPSTTSPTAVDQPDIRNDRPLDPAGTPTLRCDPAELGSCLVPRPAGARAGSTVKDGLLTVGDYLDDVYSTNTEAEQQRVRAELAAQGLQFIERSSWSAPNSDQVVTILLSFADEAGAESRYLTTTEAVGRSPRYTELRDVAPYARFYGAKALDSYGFERAKGYGRVGRVVVEEYFYSLAHLHLEQFTGWFSQQVLQLSTQR